MIDTTLIDALTQRMRRESDREKRGKENITDIVQLTSERNEGQGRVVAFLNVMPKDKGSHASKNKISRLTESDRARKKKN